MLHSAEAVGAISLRAGSNEADFFEIIIRYGLQTKFAEEVKAMLRSLRYNIIENYGSFLAGIISLQEG